MPNGLVQMRSYAGRDIVRNSCWSFMGPAYSSSRLPLGEVCCGATAHWLSASHLDRLTAVICGLLGPCTPWTRVFYGELTEIASDSDGVVLREREGYYLSQTWRYRCSTGTLTKKEKAGLTDATHGKKHLSSDGFCVAKSRILFFLKATLGWHCSLLITSVISSSDIKK